MHALALRAGNARPTIPPSFASQMPPPFTQGRLSAAAGISPPVCAERRQPPLGRGGLCRPCISAALLCGDGLHVKDKDGDTVDGLVRERPIVLPGVLPHDLGQGSALVRLRLEKAHAALPHDGAVIGRMAARRRARHDGAAAVQLKGHRLRLTQKVDLVPFWCAVKIERSLPVHIRKAEIQRHKVDALAVPQAKAAAWAGADDGVDGGGISHFAVCSSHKILLSQKAAKRRLFGWFILRPCWGC